jgi:uncharacterized protein (TIGR02996 family)
MLAMEEDGFIRAIVECPEDDAPRLIFCDWLDDNGQHDRANFIRKQIAAVAGDSHAITSAGHSGVLSKLLDLKVWEFLPKHRVTVPGRYLVQNSGWTWVEWRRGFPYRFGATLPALLSCVNRRGRGVELFKRHPIQEVVFPKYDTGDMIRRRLHSVYPFEKLKPVPRTAEAMLVTYARQLAGVGKESEPTAT